MRSSCRIASPRALVGRGRGRLVGGGGPSASLVLVRGGGGGGRCCRLPLLLSNPSCWRRLRPAAFGGIAATGAVTRILLSIAGAKLKRPLNGEERRPLTFPARCRRRCIFAAAAAAWWARRHPYKAQLDANASMCLSMFYIQSVLLVACFVTAAKCLRI